MLYYSHKEQSCVNDYTEQNAVQLKDKELVVLAE